MGDFSEHRSSSRMSFRAKLDTDSLVPIWRALRNLPGGRWLFSRLVGRMAPYSGSIRSTVIELEPGRARVELKDRRLVRNHLNSIHAIALANLGELTSGLAVMSTLPPGSRGIITGLSMEYFKKARGRLLAESACPVHLRQALTEDIETTVVCHIRDTEGDEVARARVLWRLGPIPQK